MKSGPVLLLMLSMFAGEIRSLQAGDPEVFDAVRIPELIEKAESIEDDNEYRALLSRSIVPGTRNFLEKAMLAHIRGFDPKRYTNMWESGWLTIVKTPVGRKADWPFHELPDYAVFISSRLACSVDVVPKARFGWTLPLDAQKTRIRPAQAAALTRKHLKEIGVDASTYLVRTAWGLKYHYIPLAKASFPQLPEALTCYVTFDPPEIVIRYEYGNGPDGNLRSEPF